jgi:hypothetical protein
MKHLKLNLFHVITVDASLLLIVFKFINEVVDREMQLNLLAYVYILLASIILVNII